MEQIEKIQGTEKEFIKVFQELCYSRSSWQVWADLMAAMACTLANSVDKTEPRHTAREKEYAECIKRLGGVEKPAKCFAIVVEALERNPDQDFLGKLYMSLELGNHWKGQFFTPYNVCECMASITINDNVQTLEKQEWISVNDPACGAGATLVAAANIFHRKKINYQTRVLFTANDIDRVVAQMCYIQLSLLGCAGYICIGNTITNPLVGHVLFPQEMEGQELWITPMFQSNVWAWRRLFHSLGSLGGSADTKQTIEKEHYYMFFDFEKKEEMQWEQI